MSGKVKISIVSYTNTLPFKWALKNSALMEQIELQEDIPSICAQKLKFNQVDLALIPVALLPELDNFFIETDFCIGARGKVDSVKLYSNEPIDKVKMIRLDYQSRSSVALAKILSKFFWKLDARFEDAKPGFESKIGEKEANVVIGDRTFDLNGKFKFEYDLAEEWMKFTGLPFVFAAWVSTQKQDEKFIREFNKVLEQGVSNIEQSVKEKKDLPMSHEKILFYLTQRINYRLDEEKRKALEVFLNYLRQT